MKDMRVCVSLWSTMKQPKRTNTSGKRKWICEKKIFRAQHLLLIRACCVSRDINHKRHVLTGFSIKYQSKNQENAKALVIFREILINII